jgi:predicted PurR-regulated permease PerM
MTQKSLNDTVSYLDLRLLLEHCQNIIQMNTIILEQHKQIFSNQKNLIDKYEIISNTQIKCHSYLLSITDKINTYIQNINEINKSISNIYEKMNILILNKTNNIENKIDNIENNNIKNHSSLVNKFYMILGGTLTIIISLIGLLSMIYEKHKIIEHVDKIIIEILKYVK